MPSRACGRCAGDTVLFATAGLWVWLGIDGYAITSAVTGHGPSNSTAGKDRRPPVRRMARQLHGPSRMIAAPGLGLLGPGLAMFLSMARPSGSALIASALGIFGIIGTAGVSMFPFLMPSNIAPAASLTVWDGSSSRLTLFVMLVATLIFLPIVLVYTAIAFRALRGVVTAAWVEQRVKLFYTFVPTKSIPQERLSAPGWTSLPASHFGIWMFVPHRIENAADASKTNAENPSKVPHRKPSIEMS